MKKHNIRWGPSTANLLIFHWLNHLDSTKDDCLLKCQCTYAIGYTAIAKYKISLALLPPLCSFPPLDALGLKHGRVCSDSECSIFIVITESSVTPDVSLLLTLNQVHKDNVNQYFLSSTSCSFPPFWHCLRLIRITIQKARRLQLHIGAGLFYGYIWWKCAYIY